MSSMSPQSNFSFGTRLRIRAEEQGYSGKGAVAFPVMTKDGNGTIPFVVSEDDLDTLPKNAVILNPKTGAFHQQQKGDDGNMAWKDLGSNPDFEAIVATAPSAADSSVYVPPLESTKPGDAQIADPQTTVNVDAPAGARDGTSLFAGTGNPIGKMVVASNGEIALAGAIRYHKDLDLLNAETEDRDVPTYVLNITQAKGTPKDWIFVYSASLEDTKYGNKLGDLYRLTLQVRNLDNDRQLNLTGRWLSSKNQYVFESGNLSISDNDINEGKLVQNIQRVTFYESQLTPEIGEESNAPIGNYEFTLTATRRSGKAKPVVLKFRAAVEDFVPDDTSFITAPVKSNNGSVPAPGLKSDGTLLIGSNNANTKYVTAKNGELALAGACRWFNKGAAFDPQIVSGVPVFNFNLYEGTNTGVKDWNWHYSYVLENSKNADGILDLYDISMIVTDLSSGNSLEAVGKFENGVFSMVHEASNTSITDNATNADGSVCQNIQRITFYKDLLGDVELGTNTGSPIGDFQFELKAVRKIGDVEPLSLVWRAHVTDVAPPPPEPEEPEEPEVPVDPEPENPPTNPEPANSPLRVVAQGSSVHKGRERRTGYNRLTSRMVFNIGSGDVFDLGIRQMNWMALASGVVQGTGNPITINKAVVEYQGVVVPITWGGERTIRIADNTTSPDSDLIPAEEFGLEELPIGDQFYVTIEFAFDSVDANYAPYTARQSNTSAGALNVWWNPDTGSVADIDAGGALVRTGTTEVRPQGPTPIIVGHFHKSDPAVWVVHGDSISEGADDGTNAKTTSSYGWVGRTFSGSKAESVAFLNLAVYGSTTILVVNNPTMFAPLYDLVNKAMINLGTNNLGEQGTGSLTTLQTHMQTIANNITARNPEITAEDIVVGQLPPRAINAADDDNFATLEGQQVAPEWDVGGAADRHNQWLQSRVGTSWKLAIRHTSIRAAANDARWVTNGTAQYMTADGTHPKTPGHAAMAVDAKAQMKAANLL